MIDPIVSLAFSVYSNHGVYALLLGSGVSRSAGIPTGWEVVLDLIAKVAATYGESAKCAADRPAWYRSKFEAEPEYSALLRQVAKSPAERASLVKSYFEPTEDERSQGLKVPTAAHKAIARLVSQGLIRVIVTTNFDRLLETSLQELGVTPQVIATPDATRGALPLVHSKCTIIKVNGDYLDTRIRNTETELSKYPRALCRLLDQVFDEYGLLVCGWSAAWDVALRDAIQRCKSRRFTTYWTHRGSMDGLAQSIIAQRQAIALAIESADSFFLDLEEKIAALRDVDQQHPLTAKIAAATTKRYLVSPDPPIRLHDFVMGAAESLYNRLMDGSFSLTQPFNGEELVKRVARYESLSEVLINVLLVGCYWGDFTHVPVWQKALRRVFAAEQRSSPGSTIMTDWRRLQGYPGLLLTYAAGIAAVSAGKYDALKALLTNTRIPRADGTDDEPLVMLSVPHLLIEAEACRDLPKVSRHTPLNDQLHSVLRSQFALLIPDDREFTCAFDRFEYFVSMIWADLADQSLGVPVGRFAWTYRGRRSPIEEVLADELENQGDQWPPLAAGLLGGSPDRAKKAMDSVNASIRGRAWRVRP